MSKNIKILLAEDDANLGNLLCDYLKAKGYHTVWPQMVKKRLICLQKELIIYACWM